MKRGLYTATKRADNSHKSAFGKLGELAAARYLRGQGFDLCAANYHSRFGEIDIIAKDEKYILFVEVKTRTEGSLVSPCEAVDFAKQQKIIKTALMYLSETQSKLQPRFDVIEVITSKSAEFEIKKLEHIQNAFTAD